MCTAYGKDKGEHLPSLDLSTLKNVHEMATASKDVSCRNVAVTLCAEHMSQATSFVADLVNVYAPYDTGIPAQENAQASHGVTVTS